MSSHLEAARTGDSEGVTRIIAAARAAGPDLDLDAKDDVGKTARHLLGLGPALAGPRWS